jgi:hypothetical protein
MSRALNVLNDQLDRLVGWTEDETHRFSCGLAGLRADREKKLCELLVMDEEIIKFEKDIEAMKASIAILEAGESDV